VAPPLEPTEKRINAEREEIQNAVALGEVDYLAFGRVLFLPQHRYRAIVRAAPGPHNAAGLPIIA